MDSLDNLVKSCQNDPKRLKLSNWNWNKSGAACIADLLKTGFLSDLTLYVGTEKEEVKVHRLVLQMASQTFYRVFVKHPKVDKLEIADVDSSTFKIFLEFLYSCSGSELINMENAEPLLAIATKYEVEGLAQICTEIVKKNFTYENVCKLLQKGMDYGNKELVNSALLYFSKKARKMIQKDDFLKLSLDSVYEIVQRDDLRVGSEIQLFDAIVRWGEAECERQGIDPINSTCSETNLGKEIKKLIPLIRYPLMDEQEFIKTVVPKQILSMEESYTVNLLQRIPFEERASVHGIGATAKFNAKPRKYYEPFSFSVERFPQDNLHRTPLKEVNTEKLNVKVNENVSLVGIKFLKESSDVSLINYVTLNHPIAKKILDKFEAKIIIREDSSEQKTLFQLDLQPFDPLKMMDILFEPAVPFKAEIQYCVEISFSGSLFYLQLEFARGNYSFTKCANEVRVNVDDEHVKISFSRPNGDSMHLGTGIISGLIFNSC